MDKKTGILVYNYDNKRMGILDVMDLWADDGLYCGETLEVYIDGEWKADKLELSGLNGTWFIAS